MWVGEIAEMIAKEGLLAIVTTLNATTKDAIKKSIGAFHMLVVRCMVMTNIHVKGIFAVTM